MSEAKTVLYEGLFLLNQQRIAGDLDGGLAAVREMLDRAEAEVLSLRKWDERKLAYPVEGQKRGLYVLSLFRARPTQIANIERDCNLSELVMRVMMIRADHMGETEMAEELEAAAVLGSPVEGQPAGTEAGSDKPADAAEATAQAGG